MAAFCGADGVGDVSRERVNRSISQRSLVVLRRVNRLVVRSRFNTKPLLGARTDGERAALFLRWRVDPLLRRYGLDSLPGLSRAFDAAAQRYGESNRRLQTWVERPLAAYGYPGADGRRSAEPAVEAA